MMVGHSREMLRGGLAHIYAQQILPILVRQAQAQEPISYGFLAREIGIHHRPMGQVLGVVGRVLSQLSIEMGEEVPRLQTLAVGKDSKVPGDGLIEFIKNYGAGMTVREKRAAMQPYWQKVYSYPNWERVLKQLGLKPAVGKINRILDDAAAPRRGGEGADHLALKNYIAANPNVVGLRRTHALGETEYRIASGDSVDVMFRNKHDWLAVEVKPASSPIGDLARGLFQCLKYRVVLEAETAHRGIRVSVSAKLALGRSLPSELIGLANSLNVEVVEEVRVTGATV